MKPFPGATPKELKHYCVHTLIHDKPDTVVINIGTNRIGKLDEFEISKDIADIVKIAHSHGVSKVFVSSIAYRPGLMHEVTKVNNLLRENQLLHDYELISNDNIEARHVWKDGVHLNNEGIHILANNFIRAINRIHIH